MKETMCLKYMYRDQVCTEIFVDFTRDKIRIKNHTDKIYRKAFGVKEKPTWEGLIVIRYYLALRGAENGVTAMVTPFFCVQGWISQQQARKSQESLHHPRS